MWYYLTKIVVSALVVVIVSEVAKRSSIFGALVASFPLTSLLAILWMRFEKAGTKQIADLSRSIFFLVLPSLAFFILFPTLMNRGMTFWWSFSLSIATTILLYFLLIWILGMFHISI